MELKVSVAGSTRVIGLGFDADWWENQHAKGGFFSVKIS
jgi:hypothetical protein